MVLDRDKPRMLKTIGSAQIEQEIKAWGSAAQELGVWLLLGSGSIDAGDGKVWNRSFVFDPGGNAKLMDFGIARATRREEESRGFAGTLGYASPEVMQGGEGGPASDVFSFGVMLQELLTGRRPWSGSEPKVLVDRVLNEPPAPLTMAQETASSAPAGRRVAPAVAIGSQLVTILARCLARDPADRFPDARALCEALDAVSDA